MKIVVTSTGGDLDAPASPVFGRCPYYVFVDPDTWQFQAVENPAMSAPGGAGIQAAQFVIEQGAQAVLTGHVGPNAYNIFRSAGTPVYLTSGGTVRQAAEAFAAGRLPSAADATVQAHAGMGMGTGMGAVMARGMGTGMGRGRGMGRGMGTGMGRGRGMGVMPPAGPPAPPAPAREEEIAALRDMAGELRKQLADVVERIEKLEKGE